MRKNILKYFSCSCLMPRAEPEALTDIPGFFSFFLFNDKQFSAKFNCISVFPLYKSTFLVKLFTFPVVGSSPVVGLREGS